MPDPLTLVVPVDGPYRTLGPELAAKFTEMAGGSAADAEALAEALSKALDQLATGAAEGDHVDLKLQADAAGVEVTLRCGDRSSVVVQPLPARRS